MKFQFSSFKYLFVYLFIGLFVYSFIPIAQAQTPGIEVSPSFIQLDLATDKPQTTLTYTNHTNTTILLQFSASDSTGLDEESQVSFLQSQKVQNFQYGLSSWIGFSNSSLLLNPGDKGSITFYLDANKLSPGGHYGSILAQIEEAPGQGNVAIKSIMAIPIFVRTHTGKEYEKGSITTFQAEQNWWDFPQTFLLRFTNSGDTYLTPYGIVKIYDAWGNYVGKGVINTGSLLILPESLRRLEIPTQVFTSILWPGIYHATLTVHFGKTNQQLLSTTTFFSLGTLPLLQILITALIAVNIFLFWKKRHHT